MTDKCLASDFKCMEENGQPELTELAFFFFFFFLQNVLEVSKEDLAREMP